VVDLQFKSNPIIPIGINNLGHGLHTNDNGTMGGFYKLLTTTSIKVYRGNIDEYAAKVRIRIWVYN